MQPQAILETVVYATDLAAAERFYRDVLGLQLVSRVEGRQIFLRCGAQMLLIFNPLATSEPPKSGTRVPVPPHGAHGPGHVCFAATSAEIARWRDHLAAHAIALEADFEWPNTDPSKRGQSIYLRDPAGNSIEFAEPRIWGLGGAEPQPA
jgi:catechol 2,3-dioxygenase-like lactoylglutathione lyase family enzyme